MTGDETINRLADQVRQLEQRCRRLTLLFAVLVVGIVAVMIGSQWFGQSLGWTTSAHEVKANHLVVRTIDLVDLDGNRVCHFYAHRAMASNAIELDIRSEAGKSLITLSYEEGKARILTSGAADNWNKKEIGK